MLIENAVLLAIAALLSILALITAFFMASEVVRLVRDFIASQSEVKKSPSDETPVSTQTRQRTSRAKSRATVQRLITHFEEEQRSSRRDEKE